MLHGFGNPYGFSKLTEAHQVDVQESRYICSNDVIQVAPCPNSLKEAAHTFLGIGNAHFLHCLANVLAQGYVVDKVVAVDFSCSQIKHAQYMWETLLASSDRVDFVRRFYCLDLGKSAVELLNTWPEMPVGFTNGAFNEGRSSNLDMELAFWQDVTFKDEEFKARYGQHTQAVKVDRGIQIASHTIGDITQQVLTLSACHNQDFTMTPFTLSYGGGFLVNETIFQAMKTQLISSKPLFIHDDISILGNALLKRLAYDRILFWASNVFSTYFIKKHPPLADFFNLIKKRAASKRPPNLNIQIIQDKRADTKLDKRLAQAYPNQAYLPTTHWHAFHKVSDVISPYQRILEVVNELNHIKADLGCSKLLNTDYLASDCLQVMKKEALLTYDCIFLHILLGHGMSRSEFKRIFALCRAFGKDIVILEHNRFSKDFAGKNSAPHLSSLEEIRELCGKEDAFYFCHGEQDDSRNLLLLFKSKPGPS